MNSSSVKHNWQQHQSELNTSNEIRSDLLQIGIAASFTVDPLLPYLGGGLLSQDIKPAFSIGPYNQIYQLCVTPNIYFNGNLPKIIVILWRFEDVFPEILFENNTQESEFSEKLFSEIDVFFNAIVAFSEKFDGLLVVSTPPFPSVIPFDLAGINNATSLTQIYRKLLVHWIAKISNLSKVRIIDLDALLSLIGYKSSYDVRKWYLYKQPYTEQLWALVGKQLTRIIAAHIKSSKKCVVLDCDNTLWGGIVGEDGLGGIVLGHDFPGSAYRDFQKFLKQLSKKGIFLAIASRNNEDDVFDVFENRDEMALKREDISVFEINWGSKVDSITRISKKLNIGIDSMVFIDDNPKEIAEIQKCLPDVTCIMVPEETASLPDLLRESHLFDIDELTTDDFNRVQRMKDETLRIKESQVLTKQEFMETLQLTVRVFKVSDSHIPRVTQLINKTNQFNLTTIRRTQGEIEQLTQSKQNIILGLEVSDRFGDYGLVGAAILTNMKVDEWLIDTFLLSCRVLGRSVETSFLDKIAEVVKRYEGKILIGEYRPSKKNSLVEDMYKNHGFHQRDDQFWVTGVEDLPKPESYVNVSLEL